MAGGGWRQPLVIVALQRAASMTDTSLVTWFAVYSVWVSVLTSTDSGSSPVWMVGGCRLAQAFRWVPLQTSVLTADKVSSFWFTTYTVCSGASTTSQNATSKNSGGATVTLPGFWAAQAVRSLALHVRPSKA